VGGWIIGVVRDRPNWVWKYNYEQTKVTRPNKHVADTNFVFSHVLSLSPNIFYNWVGPNILSQLLLVFVTTYPINYVPIWCYESNYLIL